MKNLKSEKGAITLFVLLACLFFVISLLGVYNYVQNRNQASNSEYEKVKENYEKDVGNEEIVYEKVNSSKLFFMSELEKNKVVMDRTGVDINITISNNNGILFNSFPVNYEISLTENSKYALSIDGEENIDNTISKTIYGNSLINEKIILRLTKIPTAILKSEENITVKIKTVSPYESEIYLPVTINTNPSTLSGIELNFLMKNSQYAPEGDVYEYYSVDANRKKDYTIKKIVFGNNDEYQSEITGITAEAIDVNRIGVVNLYRKLNSDNKTYTIYILSEERVFELSENAAWTFDKLYALESIENLHLLDTSKVINMRDMFCDCASLTSVDLSNFDTKNVTNMIGMFARMYSLEYLDLLSFDTQNLIEANQMFSEAKLLKAIYVSDRWQLPHLIDGVSMFGQCTNLVGENGTVYVSNKSDNTMAVIDGTTAGYLSSVYNFLDGINVNHIIKGKTQEEIQSWTKDSRYSDNVITSITFGKTRDYYKMIEGYKGVAADKQRAGGIQIYRIPNGSGKYEVYILSNSGIFIANMDASWMFDKLTMLNRINNLNLLDTSGVTMMRDMFCDCQSLATMDLSKMDTNNVTSMEGMFARMYSIKELNLSSFDTGKVTTMLNMFCENISEETIEIFKNATPALEKIYVSNLWTTNNLNNKTEGVFYNTTKLVGGVGTIYNSNNVSSVYARIDTTTTPGYLTLK